MTHSCESSRAGGPLRCSMPGSTVVHVMCQLTCSHFEVKMEPRIQKSIRPALRRLVCTVDAQSRGNLDTTFVSLCTWQTVVRRQGVA